MAIVELSDITQSQVEWLKQKQRNIIQDCDKQTAEAQANIDRLAGLKAEAEAVLAELETKFPAPEVELSEA